MERQRRVEERLFVIVEPERCASVEDFQLKLPPLPRKDTDNLWTEVNWVI